MKIFKKSFGIPKMCSNYTSKFGKHKIIKKQTYPSPPINFFTRLKKKIFKTKMSKNLVNMNSVTSH